MGLIMSENPTPTKTVKDVIKWKNPDIHNKLARWGEFREFFVADIEIDPKTGSGTIQFRKPR